MMVLRLITYFISLFFFCSLLAVSAVCWSFYESVNSSFNLLKYTSDNKARDILATVARVAEAKMNQDGFSDMNEFFFRMIKQSEKDLDKFTIREVFMISNDGQLLAHSNPSEIATESESKKGTKYNKPYFMRALRMRKGQLPTPQVFGSEIYKGEGGLFNNLIMKLFPELKYQVILLSSPIYHSEKLETVGSIHLIYNRGNVLFFIENQKEIFLWMFWNYIGISFLVSLILFGIYTLLLFGAYKQAARKFANLPEPEVHPTLSKLSSIVEKQEDTINRYLTPIPLKMNNSLLNMASLTEVVNEVHPENLTSSDFEKIDLNITEAKIEAVKEEPKQTEALDAIYLD